MDRSEDKSPRPAKRDLVLSKTEGAVCQWHTSSADRAEGETAARREQAQCDNREARSCREPPRLNFLKFDQIFLDINAVRGYTSARELKSSLLCAFAALTAQSDKVILEEYRNEKDI